ncbi:hypothetical protein BKA64DRAFT_34926 [Cadophora sp. MPI-SDFR-AT-0126]|nr:hypothetical protein BKA64DRAFT_34926 [Leotiomycetes sp. MPI-SDFR-AT-0126]
MITFSMPFVTSFLLLLTNPGLRLVHSSQRMAFQDTLLHTHTHERKGEVSVLVCLQHASHTYPHRTLTPYNVSFRSPGLYSSFPSPFAVGIDVTKSRP